MTATGSALLFSALCNRRLLQLPDLSLAELKLHAQGQHFSLQLLLV
jgi:hypothetical protein